MKRASLLMLLALLPAGLGCRRGQDRNLVVAAPTAPIPPARGTEPALRLDAAVKAHWTHMKIGVIDLAERKETTYDVPAGRDFTLPGSGLTLRILALVPDFTLDNGVITSRTDTPANPAARVLITEGGREVFRGWLFARFPETHPFEHPRYAVRLLELEPDPSR